MDIFSRITSADNLYWAWSKAQRMFTYGDSWIDIRELTRFESNLNLELESIANDIQNGKYSISPLRPILYPKKVKDCDETELRQWFSISIRDQVTWIAVVNIIGPFLDYQMPSWSYGYRLYRPVWYEKNEKGKIISLKADWYRNTSGHLYRKFNQSWPLYRRQVYLTSRQMTKTKYQRFTGLTEGDIRILDREEKLTAEELKLKYLRKDYWKVRLDEVYWASVDFKKFFPSVSLQSIKENIKKYLENKWTSLLEVLIDALLTIPLNSNGFTQDELKSIFPDNIGLDINQSKLTGLPTGLFVSGFLANVAMLGIDLKISEISKKYQVAHFRYVDDHTVLSSSFDTLVEWINFYKETLRKELPGVVIKEEKTEPKEFRDYIFPSEDKKKEIDVVEKEARQVTCLDPEFPTPLMTKTLALVSAINDVEFDLLDEQEQEQLLENLEHLLLVNIPDHELRIDTRISFAASKIARLAPIRFPYYSSGELFELLHSIQQREEDKQLLVKDARDLKRGSSKFVEISKLINKQNEEIRLLKQKVKELRKKKNDQEDKEKRRTFSLLLKTLEDYPEKLRIWIRAIEFCRTTGFSGFRPILQNIEMIKKNCPGAYPFYRSFMLEVFSKQIYLCLRYILDRDLLIQHKCAAIKFLYGLFASDNLFRLYSISDEKYYEISSRQVFECSIGTMVLILKDIPDMLGIEEEVRSINEYAIKFKYLDFENPVEWLSQNQEYGLAVWAWLADQKIALPTQSVPSVIWSKSVRRLNPEDVSSWSFLKKYPQSLSDNNQFFKWLISGKPHPIDIEDQGLFYEYVNGLSDNKKAKAKQCDHKMFKDILKNIESSEKVDYINLYEWIDGLNELRIKNPFDPRLSEWTAVTIVYKICLIYRDVSNISKKSLINPSNYLLPKKWANIDLQLSWKDWQRMIGEGKIKLAKNLMRDDRYAPIFLNRDSDDRDFAPIRGLGMVLLTLILNNYKLPSVWNPKGQRRVWAYLIRILLNDTVCSSWTGAILEACLSSRSRENLNITSWQGELFPNHAADDQDGEHLSIASIDDLESKLKCVQEQLIKYQVSVQNNLPRQLTPVAVSQLQRTILFDEHQEE
jgi:hypothetical protein